MPSPFDLQHIHDMTPNIITQSRITGLLSKRPHDSHKGMFGSVALIGGATGMIGATLLAARAALKMGAGCVHIGLLANNAPTVDMQQPELMLHDAHTALQLPDTQVLVIGCGMGRDRTAKKLLAIALQGSHTLIMDADALNLLASDSELRQLLSVRTQPTLLTPHPGEAARLLTCTTTDIQTDRIGSVRQLARLFNCSVILKGAHSLCFTRTGELFINHTGNPGMSAPGMGDVLAGMIAAFIAQGLNTDDALLLAVHLHGAAGDELMMQNIYIGMTASEVTNQARQLLNQWV